MMTVDLSRIVEEDTIDGIRLLRLLNRIDGYVRWAHPLIFDQSPIEIEICNFDDLSELHMYISYTKDVLETDVFGVWFWYTDQRKARKIEDLKLIEGMAYKIISSDELQTIKQMMVADDAIIRVGQNDIIIDQKYKTAITEIISVWEKNKKYFSDWFDQ